MYYITSCQGTKVKLTHFHGGLLITEVDHAGLLLFYYNNYDDYYFIMIMIVIMIMIMIMIMITIYYYYYYYYYY